MTNAKVDRMCLQIKPNSKNTALNLSGIGIIFKVESTNFTVHLLNDNVSHTIMQTWL